MYLIIILKLPVQDKILLPETTQFDFTCLCKAAHTQFKQHIHLLGTKSERQLDNYLCFYVASSYGLNHTELQPHTTQPHITSYIYIQLLYITTYEPKNRETKTLSWQKNTYHKGVFVLIVPQFPPHLSSFSLFL